jgi:hypothetical protein
MDHVRDGMKCACPNIDGPIQKVDGRKGKAAA